MKAIVFLFLGAALSLPALAEAPSRPPEALVGTVNYFEGQASIGNEALSGKSVGAVQLQPGQFLTTQNGRVEVLLTPGTFLRLGKHSAVKMIAPSLIHTEVAVEKGQATVEVTDLDPQNDLRIDEAGGSARLVKNGFDDFDAGQQQIRVFDGEARVQAGDQHAMVKGGHSVALRAAKLKARKFDKKEYEAAGLHKWSTLRSAYLA